MTLVTFLESVVTIFVTSDAPAAIVCQLKRPPSNLVSEATDARPLEVLFGTGLLPQAA